MKIGYVGLGAMGSALAKWLCADHSVLVWDLNPAAMERFAANGATPATSLPQLAADSDLIFLCLPRSKDVEKAIFGAGGLAEGLAPGKLVIDQTSGVALETRSMADRLNALGVDLLDAPVAGGVPSAVGGTITIMVSGPDEAQTRAMPAFQAMTSKIYRASSNPGDAQSVKTLNNMMNMEFRCATLELASLAVSNGLPLKDLTEDLKAGIGGNFTCRTVLPAIVEGRSTGDFFLTLMLKDNNQALSLGMAADVPMLLSSIARSILQQNIKISGDQSKLDDIITFMAQATGVDYTKPADVTPPADLVAHITTALAASNRAVAYEILSVAAKMGMGLTDFCNILNNGSAWSRELETVIAELAGGPKPTRKIGESVAAMQALEGYNLTNGVSTVMMSGVRAVFELAQRELGADATVDQLAKFYERVGDVILKA